MPAGKFKGTKVDLTQVIGSTKAHIPDRPQEREDGDPGFFKRENREYGRRDNEYSRGGQDDDWRGGRGDQRRYGSRYDDRRDPPDEPIRMERPRLNLKKREVPLEESVAQPAKASPFGGARPINTKPSMDPIDPLPPSSSTGSDKWDKVFAKTTRPSSRDGFNSRLRGLDGGFGSRGGFDDRPSSREGGFGSNRRERGFDADDRGGRPAIEHTRRFDALRDDPPPSNREFGRDDQRGRRGNDYSRPNERLGSLVNERPRPYTTTASQKTASEPKEEFPDLKAAHDKKIADEQKRAQRQIHQPTKKPTTPTSTEKTGQDDDVSRIAAEKKKKQQEQAQADEEKKKAEAAAAAKKVEEASSFIAACTERGDALAQKVKEMSPDLRALTKALISVKPDSIEWTKKNEYGAALVALHNNDIDKQFQILLGVQDQYHSIGFPKDDKGQGYVQACFKALYLNEIVSDEGQQFWRNDEHLSEKVPGKVDALVQCNAWFSFLDSLDEEDDESDEEDNIDDEDDDED